MDTSVIIVVLSLIQTSLTLACDDGIKSKCMWYTLISRHAKISDMDVFDVVRVRSKLECSEQCGSHRQCLTFSVSHDVTGSVVFITSQCVFCFTTLVTRLLLRMLIISSWCRHPDLLGFACCCLVVSVTCMQLLFCSCRACSLPAVVENSP